MSEVVTLNQFVTEIGKMKETLQGSLSHFRQAQKRIEGLSLDQTPFLFRRCIQLEREALVRFKNDLMNTTRTLEILLNKVTDQLMCSTDWGLIQNVAKQLRSIQLAFAQECPAIDEALQKIEGRLNPF